MHAKLFLGVFAKALSNLQLLKINTNIKISVISDTLNKGEVKLFQKEVRDIINIFSGKDIERDLTSYDKKNNKLIKAHSVSKIQESSFEDDLFNGIDIEISHEQSALTLLADILANSAFYTLSKYLQDTKGYSDLNTKAAIKDHPISRLVLGVSDHENEHSLPDFFDMLYRKRST